MLHAIDIIIENFGTIGTERKRIMMSVIQKYSRSSAPLEYAFNEVIKKKKRGYVYRLRKKKEE